MKIVNGVEMFEISSNVMGTTSVISPTLIWDNDAVILVDAGFPGQLEAIREEIEKVGVKFDNVNMVIVTHHDIDHIGSLLSIVKEFPNTVQVLAHEEEKAYIEGEKQPLKLAKLEANLNILPEEMKVIYEKLKAGFENSKVKVNKTLRDDEELPYCGGIKVIYTPGHTLGHICLYLKQSKTLIAGDLLSIKEGVLVKASSSINFDDELTIKSLKKLKGYDIETVICYHGGMYNIKVNECIAELANK